MNYREAVKQGRKLVLELSQRQWRLGDLALDLAPLGEDRAHNGSQEVLAKFADDIGVEDGTLRQYRQCAAAWPHVNRLPSASWTVHYRLMNVPDRFKAIRSKKAWTTREAQVAAGNKPSGTGGRPLIESHGDKVETARRLLADPEVAEDVMRDDRTRRQASKATEKVAREMVSEAEGRDRQRYPRETADRDVLAVVSYINDADERVKAALRVIRDGFEITAEWRPALLDATERLENTTGWLRTVVESKHRTADDALDAMLRGER